MIDEDLAAVYYSDDFATDFQVQGQAAPPFPAILGEADQEALQGYAVGTVHMLHYATAAATLSEGDHITSTHPQHGPRVWRILRAPRLVLDGAESVAYLTAA